jgi:hypothetical protein
MTPRDFVSRSHCKPKTNAAPASGVAEHVHTTIQLGSTLESELLRRLSAAADLAPTDGASDCSMSEEVMHDIADLIYKRIATSRRFHGFGIAIGVSWIHAF